MTTTTRTCVTFVFLVTTTIGAQADPPSRTLQQTGQPLDSVVQRPLFEKWEPRQWLAERGVTLNAHFIAETAVNERGYKSAGWNYTQHLDFGAVVDLDKLGVGDGTVRVVFSDRLGEGLHAERTGAYIQNQAYFGQGQNLRFDELSYERFLLDKRLSLKAGFYAMGNDFAGLPYVCNFNNNGNCGHPLGLLYGSGWVDSPTGQWGTRLKWTDDSGWYTEAGIYDVTPVRKTEGHGFDLGFSGTTGFIAPLEIGYVNGKTSNDYPGTYKFGVYYDSSRVADLEEPTHQINGRSGAYLQAAQQIWKPQPGVVQGISIFGVATINDKSTGLFTTTYEAGASWRGMIPGRGDDIASIGWTQLNLNKNVQRTELRTGKAVQTDEQMLEVNYGAQVEPWLLLRPAAQFVIRPGGYENRPDTFVFTLHVQGTF